MLARPISAPMSSPPSPPLSRYRQKRNFAVTSEPAGEGARAAGSERLSFVVQKHWASRLHYDFRLELDGEIVVMNGDGLPDFNALQNAIDNAASEAIEYFVFDLPFHDGRDLRKVPLRARRALLGELLETMPSDRIRLSQSFPATPAQMLEAARSMQLEGIIIKRPDAPYVSQRTETWLKLKCALRQEFVICGFTDRNGARGEVGSLFLGTWEKGVIASMASVGVVVSSATRRACRSRAVRAFQPVPTLPA